MPRRWCWSVLLVATLTLVLAPCGARGDFHRGDLVPTARRAQFHGVRTHWHDLLGKHCPKFALDHIVALPIPRPVSFKEEDEYKIAFTFDGDRHLTSWLTILSKPLAELHSHDEKNPVVPMIDVELQHGGGEIHKARARTVAVSDAYLKEHAELVREYHNATAWPKHLLIRYRWVETVDVDADAGMVMMLGLCLVASVGVMVSVVAAYNGEAKTPSSIPPLAFRSPDETKRRGTSDDVVPAARRTAPYFAETSPTSWRCSRRRNGSTNGPGATDGRSRGSGSSGTVTHSRAGVIAREPEASSRTDAD